MNYGGHSQEYWQVSPEVQESTDSSAHSYSFPATTFAGQRTGMVNKDSLL